MEWINHSLKFLGVGWVELERCSTVKSTWQLSQRT